jgi:superfamily I DNA and/or RNA helicase
MAQVQLLCDRIEEIPGAEGVQVASVDSFQGREADAVVISMVVLQEPLPKSSRCG